MILNICIYTNITIPHGNALDHLLHARRLATNLVRCPGWDFDGAGACDFVGVVVIYKLSSFVYFCSILKRRKSG